MARPSFEQDRPLAQDIALGVSLLGDAVAAVLGLLLGYWIRFHSPVSHLGFAIAVRQEEVALEKYAGLIAIGAVFLIASFMYLRLYSVTHLLRFRRVSSIIVRGATFWLVAYLSINLALKFNPPISRIYVFISFFSCLICLLGWRWLFHRILGSSVFFATLQQSVLLVGWNEETGKLLNAILSDASHPYRVVGWVALDERGGEALPPKSLPRMGGPEVLESLIQQRVADMVVLADMNAKYEEVVQLSNWCERALVQFKVVPTYFQILVSGLQLETISGVPIMGVADLPLNRITNRTVKRLIDIFGACVGLFFGAPIMAVCAVLIYSESPGPIFFSQERVGRLGRRFKMVKLRSMLIGADKHDHLNQSTLRQDPRVLRIGGFMRKWNIDEVPQFWNVLMGDMSLVGPRPERTFHSEKLSNEIPHYNARYSCKPGITGWAQVNGLRGDTSLVERIRYDLYYLENWNLWLDIQIMFQTFVKRDNAY
ncbi:MAG TPA: exopolysaccharide biosynthesis polyprenyl glycosylphosphotransferase [Candidatus Limnocylindria bacterium]|nr:exopolysaccharide biosynthesis polyprenyl glycosylphosphotransferase [Candidatus Limnocylindria bacterium]